LTQETGYPAADLTTFAITLSGDAAFTVFLRIPSWLRRPATVRLNGKQLAVRAAPGTYAEVHRTWRSGDRIELVLPQEFRTEPIDELHPETVALMRGPVQYVALNAAVEPGGDRLTLPAGLKQVTAQSFVENYGGEQIVFVPLYRVQNETYTTYFSKA
jgi:DUF1680 family protein